MRPYNCIDAITDLIVIFRADTQVHPYIGICGSASHIGVFGEGSGEGVFAKTPSPQSSFLPPPLRPCGKLSLPRINFEPVFLSAVPPEK